MIVIVLALALGQISVSQAAPVSAAAESVAAGTVDETGAHQGDSFGGVTDKEMATSTGTTATTTVERDRLPAQLFDINLEVETQTVDSAQDLTARLTFVNFGTKPAPVDVTFRIVDAGGNEVHRYDGAPVDIIVETEGVIRQSFTDLELPPGRYTLVAETLYDVDVFDEFRQSFEVTGADNRSALWWSSVALVVLLVLLSLLVIRKKKRAQSQEVVDLSPPILRL